MVEFNQRVMDMDLSNSQQRKKFKKQSKNSIKQKSLIAQSSLSSLT